jgi:transposase
LSVGSYCPECASVNSHGKLCRDEPKVVIKLEGNPLITGTKYTAECFRCSLCSQRYQTSWPDIIKNAPKYDVSCATTLAIGRYAMGLPLHRMEYHQAMHGIPLPDATQWDLIHGLYKVVSPIHDVMIQHAADGNMVIYDDTPGRILSASAQGQTTHTTAFISVHNGHKIHLFFTGQKHAGKNTAAILQHRTSEEPLIAMMDASPSNIPKMMNASLTARFILCFCLVHGRRKFFEIFNFFDKQCDLVLNVIGQVYQNDAHCKKEQFTQEQRLKYHQIHSKPLMDSLYIWLNNQLLYDLSEANSGLGQAVNYMLRHWHPLTTFLRVAGAPLDSSWAERAIKIAIRHRRNSLFYKTPHGASVGDCLMSLIYTAQQNKVNPFDYLNVLQQHADLVKECPSLWLPWNYSQQLESNAMAKAA